MRCAWWGSNDGGLYAPRILRVGRRTRLYRPLPPSTALCRPRLSPRHRPFREAVGSVSRRPAPPARHGTRQRRRDPGDREAAQVHVRVQPGRLHLPHYRFQLHHESRDAPARAPARRPREDRAGDHRPVRARARPADPHGASQARVQSGGLFPAHSPDPRCGGGARAGAAPLGPRGGGEPRRSRFPGRAPRYGRRARAPAARARPSPRLMSPMLEFVAGVLLAVGAVSYVLRPIFRPDLTDRELPGKGEAGRGNEGEEPDDDLSARAVALRALKEIEFDRATGKLSDADYDALKAKYAAEALAALRTEARDARWGGRDAEPSQAPSDPASRIPHPACPTHGPRPEADAEFCSECGRRLGSAPGYCARCGAALEHDARYCHACGARVAA